MDVRTPNFAQTVIAQIKRKIVIQLEFDVGQNKPLVLKDRFKGLFTTLCIS